MEKPREYWAFVSYRHADNQQPGREWATWIAREIETYELGITTQAEATPAIESVEAKIAELTKQ